MDVNSFYGIYFRLGHQVNLAITSNQIPDAMVDATQFNQMYRAGQLADLTDVYDQYASDT
ncbi:MAG: hypothetical protein ACLUOI_06215 [Eisenbergiella sp.]